LKDVAPMPLSGDGWYGPPGYGYQNNDYNYNYYGQGHFDEYDRRRGGKNGRMMRGGGGYAGMGGSRFSPYGNYGGYRARGPPMGYRPPPLSRSGYGYGGDPYGYESERPRINPNKVYMRGLPFRVTPSEIEQFFSPLVCTDIQLGVMHDGRSSGDGFVEFESYGDARQALAKDREKISNRYIELFNPSAVKIPEDVFYESVGIGNRPLISNQPPPPPPPEQNPLEVNQGYDHYQSSSGFPTSPSGYNGQPYGGAGSYGTQTPYDAYTQSYYSSYNNAKAEYNWP